MPVPRLTLSGVVLGAPDARALADFYRRLLGWPIEKDEPNWVTFRPPGGGSKLSVQTETEHVRPIRPPQPGEQQMMMHLDIEVDWRWSAGHSLPP